MQEERNSSRVQVCTWMNLSIGLMIRTCLLLLFLLIDDFVFVLSEQMCRRRAKRRIECSIYSHLLSLSLVPLLLLLRRRRLLLLLLFHDQRDLIDKHI